MGVLLGKMNRPRAQRLPQRCHQLLPKYERHVPWSYQAKLLFDDWIQDDAETWNFDPLLWCMSNNGHHFSMLDVCPSECGKGTEVILKRRTNRDSSLYYCLNLPYRLKVKSNKEAKAESAGLKPMQVCGFHKNIIVLQALSKDHHLQFIVYDLQAQVFLGKYTIKWAWESFECEVIVSPDHSYFLIKPSSIYAMQAEDNHPYLKEMRLIHFTNGQCRLDETIRDVNCARYAMAFDPRFGHTKVALGNRYLDPNDTTTHCTCIMDMRRKVPVATGADIAHNHSTKHLIYSPDGSFLTSLTQEPCFFQNFFNLPKILVYDSDTLDVVHSILCSYTQCVAMYPAVLFPSYSICGTRMVTCYGRDVDILGAVFGQEIAFVEVYKLPTPINLQYLCRIALRRLLKNDHDLKNLQLPKVLINYLAFGPVMP